MAGSGEHERAMAGSSKGGRNLLRSLDYPCTARLRLRRLLAYHRRYSNDEIYRVARDKTRVIFDVTNLVNRVKYGMFREASIYVLGFLRPDSMSYEADLLLGFLESVMVLNEFADGRTNSACLVCDWFVSIYRNPALAAYPCFATLVPDVLFLRSDHARAFLNWQLVKNKAVEMVEEMAYNIPELTDKLHFPRGPNNLYHVAPIRSSFQRRRIAKNLGRQQSTDLAQFYLQLKKRLPSSIQGGSTVFSGSPTIQQESLIALVEKALQAGRYSLLEQGHPPEYPSKEGFPLVKMFTLPPCMDKPIRGQVRQPEHSSKQDAPQSSAVVTYTETHHPPKYPSKEDISQSPAVVASTETGSAMKRMSFHESHPHPGNDSKRPRATRNFFEVPLSSVQASYGYLPVTNQRGA